MLFFFKQKTAYEMRISDWSSDVCSSDLNLNRWYLRLDFGCGFQAAHVRDFDSPSRRSLGNQRQRLRPSRPAATVDLPAGACDPAVEDARRGSQVQDLLDRHRTQRPMALKLGHDFNEVPRNATTRSARDRKSTRLNSSHSWATR